MACWKQDNPGDADCGCGSSSTFASPTCMCPTTPNTVHYSTTNMAGVVGGVVSFFAVNPGGDLVHGSPPDPTIPVPLTGVTCFSWDATKYYDYSGTGDYGYVGLTCSTLFTYYYLYLFRYSIAGGGWSATAMFSFPTGTGNGCSPWAMTASHNLTALPGATATMTP